MITFNRDFTMSELVINVSVRPVSNATRLTVIMVGLSPIKLGPRHSPLSRDLFFPIQKGMTPWKNPLGCLFCILSALEKGVLSDCMMLTDAVAV